MANSTYRRKYSRKKKSTKSQIISLILFIVIAVIVYIVSQNQDQTPPSYSTLQNEEGFYYYQEAGSSDYYFDAQNLIGETLKNELHLIVNENKSLLSYAEVRQALEVVDLDLNNTSKLWGIYDGAPINAAWDGGATWNREHVWPNSRLGMDRVTDSNRNQATDLHNLRASTVSINSSKSDRFFSEGSGLADITDEGGFYPGDEHLGDVARILFYMAITYDYLILTDDGLLDESNHYTMDGTKMGKLSLLLEWHKIDPVSDFEVARNNRIFSEQGNRNPFIDRPEFAHLIWEGKTIGDLTKPEIETTIQDFNLYIERRRGLFL